MLDFRYHGYFFLNLKVTENQGGISLHFADPPNEFSWVPKFTDGVSIMEDLQYDLCKKIR